MTLDVSTNIVVDIGEEFESVPIMFNKPNEYFHEKFMEKPKESGKGDCVSG